MNSQITENSFLSLPIYQQKAKITEALRQDQIIVVESSTGSGKTTQLPLILLEQGLCDDGGIIGMTEPRRIAAVSVSSFIQMQLKKHPEFLESNGHENVDQIVGYKIRFEDTTSQNTRLKLMTDGILLQEFKQDPLLLKYSAIVIDEAHERSLNIDFILGLLREVCKTRKNLKLIISSATINTRTFSDFFFNCSVIKIEAPIYPIKSLFLPPPQRKKSSYDTRKKKQKYPTHPRERGNSFDKDVDVLVSHVVEIARKSVQNHEGDILIFLSGEKQIKNCIDQLEKLSCSSSLWVLPLYGRLDNSSQELVFKPAPSGKTKIIVATNIAETSITIDTIKVVIDSGRVKLNSFHHAKHISTLDEVPVSKAAALQRKGRSGRTGPGKCYHLYRREEFEAFEEFSKEEIYRTDLSEVVLRMAHQGIRDFEKFNFISSPKRHAIHSAVEILQELNALDEKHDITSIGVMMAEVPLLPIHARMLVEGIMKFPESLDHIIKVISFLSTPNPFLLPMGEESQARRAHRAFSVDNNDYLTYIKIFDSYVKAPYHEKEGFCESSYIDLQIMQEIYNVHDQLCSLVSHKGIPIGEKYDVVSIISAIARGLIFNICLLEQGNYYRNRVGEKIFIHPGSMLFECKEMPPILVAGELVQTSKKFARAASACKLEWIKNISEKTYVELEKTIKGRKGKRRKKKNAITLYPDITLEPSAKRERNTTDHVRIAKKKYTLHKINNKKMLSLTWKEALNLAGSLSKEEVRHYGRIRCQLQLKKKYLVNTIKLSSVPLFCNLYRKNAPVIDTILHSDFDKSVTGEQLYSVARLHSLVDTCMSLYHSKMKQRESNNVVVFCSLETGNNGYQYILPNSHFLTSLYNSMRSLEFLIEEQSDRKLLAKAQKSYSALRGTYQLLETL